MNALLRISLVALCSPLLLACGSQDGTTAGSVADLRARFGACNVDEDTNVDFAPGIDYLTGATDWVHVDSVVEAQRDDVEGKRTFPATVTTPDKQRRTLRIHTTFWPGIDWALANDSQVWVALGSEDGPGTGAGDLALYVVVVDPDGEVFFPGFCSDEQFRQPLVAAFGETDYSRVVISALGKTGPELTAILMPDQATALPSSPTYLNPQDADPELLASLDPVTMSFNVTGELKQDYTLCTQASAGGNDCVASQNPAIEINGYVGEDNTLEVWLLDANGDATKPIAHIGTIELPATIIESDDPSFVIDVQLDPDDPANSTTELSMPNRR